MPMAKVSPKTRQKRESGFVRLPSRDMLKLNTMLGLKYAIGKGVPEDDAEAVKLYRKAAEQGLAEAQFTSRGKCMPQAKVSPRTTQKL
jgi:TPR repeat protein